MEPARGDWLVVAAALTAALGAPSCRDQVVQTASRLPDAAPANGGNGGAASEGPLDCLGDAPSDALPAGAAFGDGDAPEPWLLAAGSYGPLEGPGLYVTARDTFRVYVNGHLLAESESARTPVFVPLTLLPGENVIAVAVSAEDGTPAALVALEELERSYGSGSDWRVSAAPEGDWTGAGYDDGGWAPASELGALGSLAGCEPGAAFPADTPAVWIGPELGETGPIALRQVVRVEPVGFAAGTTGGGAAEPVLVDTWAELEALAASEEPATILLAEGPHDFRRTGDEIGTVEVCPAVCADDPARTTYRIPDAGTACAVPLVPSTRTERALRVGSNKTILGLGRGAGIRGVSLELGTSENLVLRNVALYDLNRGELEAGDALNLQQAQGVWIDHVTFKWVSDAFADIFPGTAGVTFSWSLFDGGTDAECGGQERWAMTLTDAEVTVHHCRFDQISTRAPHAEGAAARAHLFNNVHSNSADWTLGSACLAQVRVEGSVFENVEAVSRRSDCGDGTELGLMDLVAGSNLYRDGTVVHLGGDGAEPHDAVFTPEYDHEVDPATDAWSRVILRAGTGGPWAQPLTLE